MEETMHRIYVEWSDGYFLTSAFNSEFHAHLQEMVSDLGPPLVVEFRADGEGMSIGCDDTVDASQSPTNGS